MTSELEKQKLLNEKLENDLLSMGTTEQKLNGDGTHASAEDLLAGLDFIKKPTVSINATQRFREPGHVCFPDGKLL